MRIKPWIYKRMDDEQKQKDYIEAIAKATIETKKFSRNLTSSVSSLVRSASDDKKRNQIIKEHIKNLNEQIKLEQSQKTIDREKIKHIKDEINATKELTTGFKFAIPSLKDFGTALGKYALETAKSTGKTAANFLDAGERVKKYSDLSKEFTGTLGSGFTKLFESLDFNVGIFKQLSLTGAGFNGSMMNLRDAAKAARMPILDFVDMIQRNSSVMAQLFGSVQSGVPQMSDFNRRLRDVTRSELSQFGLNLDDTTEFLSTYLELERSRGATQRRTTAEVVAGTRDYAKNLVLLSKLTGKSVKEIDEQNKAVAADGAFRAILADKSPEVAKGFEIMLAELNSVNPMFGQLFKEVTAFRGAANMSTAQLNLMSGSTLVRAMKAFDGSEASIINLSNALKESGTQGIRTSKSFAMASIANGDFAEQLTALAKAAGIAIDPERIRAQMLATDEFTKSAVGGRDVLDAVKASVEGTATDAQKLLIKQFGDKFPDLLKTMRDSAEKLASVDNPIALAYDKGKKAIRTVSTFFSNMGTERGAGKGTVLSTADDSVFGMTRRAVTRSQQGGEGNSWFDIITPWDTLAEKIAKANDYYDKGEHYQSGTLGVTGKLFKNFGSGTQATLHGQEAVVPKNSPLGSVLSMLEQLSVKPTVTNAPATAPANTQTNTEFMRMNSILSENLKGLSEVMVKSEKHLNTLVAISAKTEQNTGETKRGLANLSPSLV